MTLARMVAWKNTLVAPMAMDRMTAVTVEVVRKQRTNLTSNAVSSAWNAGLATSWKPF